MKRNISQVDQASADEAECTDIECEEVPVRGWTCPICASLKTELCLNIEDARIILMCCGHTLCRGCLQRWCKAAAFATTAEWTEHEQLRIWNEGGRRGIRCARRGCVGVLQVPEEGQLRTPQRHECPEAGCGANYCARCRVPWISSRPGGHVCEDLREPEQDDAARWRLAPPGMSQQLERRLAQQSAARETRPCPSCGVLTERDGGCNIMSCNCQHDWCFACGASCRTGGCGHFHCRQLGSQVEPESDSNLEPQPEPQLQPPLEAELTSEPVEPGPVEPGPVEHQVERQVAPQVAPQVAS